MYEKDWALSQRPRQNTGVRVTCGGVHVQCLEEAVMHFLTEKSQDQWAPGRVQEAKSEGLRVEYFRVSAFV